MAANNLAENKRFIYYSPEKKRTTYLVPNSKPQSRASSRPPTVPTIKISTTSPRSIATSARRVVVIRSSKQAETHREPTDLGDLELADPEKNPPVIQRGNTLVYFIRRSITASDPPKSDK